MDDATLGIAMKARLYRLLADRPNLATHNVADRIDRTAAPELMMPMCELDLVLVERAEPLDLLAGYAVRHLQTKVSRPLLDVLGMLGQDHVLGMYLALPDATQRRVVRANGVWGYHAGRVSDYHPDLPEALALIERMASVTYPPPLLTQIGVDRQEMRHRHAGLS